MRWLAITLGTACYVPVPPAGVTCDPASPACPEDQACIATETGFACLPVGTPPFDAPPIDMPPVVRSCPGNPGLGICFDFNDETLPNPLPNEGRFAVSADLVSVDRIVHDGGGAAGLVDTSSIAVPADPVLAGIVAIEAAIRMDVAVPDLMRVGIVDADIGDPGMSMFVFGTATGHQLRCNVGGQNLFVDLPIVLGDWIDLACVCDANVVAAYANGSRLGELAGCAPASGAPFGLQIGQNGRGGMSLPPNEPLIGAIDDVRLWTELPPGF